MTLVLAVLAASLLGSVHCAAMCGGFVCLYSGTGTARRAGAQSHAAYNAARLVSYLSLGTAAGFLGRGVDRIGSVAGIARLAAIVGGALMVVWGGCALLAALGVPLPRWGVPRILQAGLTSLLVRFRGKSAVVRAAATGLLTTLLPCGWLYVFVATAGGTGRVADAALVMFFFWLGTLPMMLTLGFGAQRLFGAFQRRLPLVSASAAVVLGLLSIAGKVQSHPFPHVGHTAEIGHDGR